MHDEVDAADPRLADYRHLTDAQARRAIEGSEGQGIFVVEGVLALRQLLRSRYRIRSVLSTPARSDVVEDELARSGRPAGSAPFPHLVAPRDTVERVTGFDVHRGILAAADRVPLPRIGSVLQDARRVLAVEGVNDHENLGALFRNAAALGIDAVLLDDGAADPLYRRSIRVSAGWTMRLPHTRAGASRDMLGALRGHGFATVALTPAGGATPVDVAASDGLLDEPVCFVVGAEGPGLHGDTLAACDARVCVPMTGEVDSLNVATSLAVVASFAAARRGWS